MPADYWSTFLEYLETTDRAHLENAVAAREARFTYLNLSLDRIKFFRSAAADEARVHIKARRDDVGRELTVLWEKVAKRTW